MGKMINTKFKNEDGKIIKEFTGRSWMGTYDDGELGFCVSNFMGHYSQGLSEDQRKMLEGKGWFPSDLYRVEVTVRLVTNKNGGLITKRNKNRK